MSINPQVHTCINTLINKATSVLDHFVIEERGEELYRMLCGNDERMLDAFRDAANYMEPANYHSTIIIDVLMAGSTQAVKMPFSIMMENSQKYPCYLMPKHKAVITPESKLYPRLEIGIKLAQEWAITRSLFDQFQSSLDINQLVAVLPWLRELGRDISKDMKERPEWEFNSRYNIGYMTTTKKKGFHSALERLSNPGMPGATPALSPRINQACRFGDKLFAQWRLLKKQEAKKPIGSYIAVAMNTSALPEWFIEDMGGVMAYWNEQETERRAARAQDRINKNYYGQK